MSCTKIGETGEKKDETNELFFIQTDLKKKRKET